MRLFLPFILKAVSALFIHTDGGITMLIALIQLRESPWLKFPGSVSAVGEETVSKGHIIGWSNICSTEQRSSTDCLNTFSKAGLVAWQWERGEADKWNTGVP